MSNRQTINTDKAPRAIGTYSQAVKAGTSVYISGQIPLVAETMELLSGNFKDKTRLCFENLQAIAEAAGGTLDDAAKVTISSQICPILRKLTKSWRSFLSSPTPLVPLLA